MPSNSKIDKVKSRSKVHFDYAEREQIQDRKAGLKEKGKLERRKEKAERFYPPPPLRSSPCLSGTKWVVQND